MHPLPPRLSFINLLLTLIRTRSSYCLPILNSLVDLAGQLLLLLAFEMSALLGADVRVKDLAARY